MASKQVIVILLCVISCLWLVSGDLDLPEGSRCVSDGLNGTCVGVYKCNSAALSHLYLEAGFSEGEDIPPLPAVCSHRNAEPVVCCTDCDSGKSSFGEYAIGPLGVLTNKRGPVARAKCYDYFKRLPYPCRGHGNVKIKKTWDEVKQCHGYNLMVALAVGGRNAERWEFPHMALLGYGNDKASAQWLCGGTVISERFILTAAHCSATRTLGPIKFAALGLLKRTDPKENWKIYNIKKIVKHPKYKAPIKYHDIALLETETEISFDMDLLPACLSSDVGSSRESSAEASGWGRLGHRQGLADHLQVVNVNEFNETECARLYRPHRHLPRGYDPDTQMCYGSHHHIIDTCEGDSGGPLQTNEFKCLYTVVGLTSFGKDCGVLGSPGIYTRVSHYVPWIESVVWPGETNDNSS